MHTKIVHTLSEVTNALNTSMPDQVWRRVLEVFAPTHVADSIQIQEYAGLEREKFRRVMDKLQTVTAGLPPLFHILDHPIKRAGPPGRKPKIFLLGETGAKILNELGFPDAHPCHLNDDLAIAHSLAMLDVHQVAVRENISIRTDSIVNFGDQRILRPDHQIVLADGKLLIYEIEQAANHDNFGRIRQSLMNKLDFFKSAESAGFQREIRMVINLTPGGSEWNGTIQRWGRGCRALSEGEDLGFRLLALPIGEFLVNPDWTPIASSRWLDLTVTSNSVRNNSESQQESQVSAYDQTHSAYDDVIVVNAAAQDYKANILSTKPSPDFGVFTLVYDIYNASHSAENYLAFGAIPHTSIHMLRVLMEKRADLVEKLNRGMNCGRKSEGQALVVYHMQGVIDTFLNYYQWESGEVLRAEAVANNREWNGIGPFGILVKARVAPSPGDVWGNSSEIDVALAWVLWALFKYSEQIGLDRPKFLL